jgi:two-component system, cell cycle sensor histidine kinase and response regulator CckA
MESPLCKCPRHAPRVAANRSTLLRKRILLVDDQRSVRDAINLLLGLDEHTVVGATNGVEALALFKPDRFDLVITDFEMPQMKGNELATRIKRISPSQPILMITAYAERLDNADNPVDAVLNKPFQLADLRRAVAELVG